MYCTLDDLEKVVPEEALIQLTDDEGLGDVNQARIDDAIAAADGEINAWLQEKYTIPLSPVPDIIKRFSANIAIYNLYSRRMEEIPETRRENYKNALRTLEKLSSGAMSLGITPHPSETETGGAEAIRTNDDRIFTRASISQNTTGTLDNY